MAGCIRRYYEKLVPYVEDAECLYIFGPGPNKIQFKKHLKGNGFKGTIMDIEAASTMSDPHIAAKVRDYFMLRRAPTMPPGHQPRGKQANNAMEFISQMA